MPKNDGGTGWLIENPVPPPNVPGHRYAIAGSPTASASVAPARYGPRSPRGTDTDDCTRQPGSQGRQEQDRGKREMCVEHQEGCGIGADAHQRSVAEGELSVETREDRQAGDGHEVCTDLRDLEVVVGAHPRSDHPNRAETPDREDEMADERLRRQHRPARSAHRSGAGRGDVGPTEDQLRAARPDGLCSRGRGRGAPAVGDSPCSRPAHQTRLGLIPLNKPSGLTIKTAIKSTKAPITSRLGPSADEPPT